MHIPCNLEGISWDEYRGNSQKGKDGIVKVKVKLELNLVRNAKSIKKRNYRHVGKKKKIEENALPCHGMVGLVTINVAVLLILSLFTMVISLPAPLKP